MHTKANVINFALFKKAQANVVVIYMFEMLKKKKEQQSQYVTQNVMHNNNLDSFKANFAKHFTQKPTPK